MSLAERYSRATRSSHLEMKVEIGDVDYLIAAGLVRESLATRLIRLRSEFDTISKEPRARTMIRMLNGFPVAQQYLVLYAVSEAPIRSKTLTDKEATEVATRVLDLFLDPNCPQCDGRGFNGGMGIPTVHCTVCRETGKRQHWWKTEAQEAFAAWLQASIEGKIERAMQDMRRLLRQRETT